MWCDGSQSCNTVAVLILDYAKFIFNNPLEYYHKEQEYSAVTYSTKNEFAASQKITRPIRYEMSSLSKSNCFVEKYNEKSKDFKQSLKGLSFVQLVKQST